MNDNTINNISTDDLDILLDNLGTEDEIDLEGVSIDSIKDLDTISFSIDTDDKDGVPDINISDDTLSIDMDSDTLEFDLNDEDESYEFDLTDSTSEVYLNPSLIGFKQTDLIASLESILSTASILIDLVSPNKDNSEQCKLDYTMFKMYDEEKVKVMEQSLVDIVKKQVNDDIYNEEDAVDYVIATLWEVLGWSPKGGIDSLSASLRAMYKKFRTLLTLRFVNNGIDITKYISLTDIQNLRDIITINITAFNEIGKLLNSLREHGGRNVTEIIFDNSAIYLETYPDGYSTSMTFDEHYNVIVNYLQSPTVTNIINISSQEAVDFKISELIRRLLLKDVQDGYIKIEGLAFDNSNYLDTVEQILNIGVDNNSVACELIITILELFASLIRMTGIQIDSKTGKSNAELNVYKYLFLYFKTLVFRPQYCSVAFYTAIQQIAENKYLIDYPSNDLTGVNTIETDSPLCMVIGNTNSNYAIPVGVFDEEHKCYILPPPKVIVNLKSTFLLSGYKLDGNFTDLSVVYKCIPTLNMLEKNVAVQYADKEKSALKIKDSDFSLYQIIDTYTNKFTDDINLDFETFKFGDKTIVASLETYGEEASIYKVICCLGSNDKSKGKIIKYCDGEIIPQFKLNGRDITDRNPIIEQVSIVKSVESKPSVDLRNYMDIGEVPMLNDWDLHLFKVGRAISKRYCRASALNYDKLLKNARITIVTQLSRVLRLYTLDSLLTKKLVPFYKPKNEDFKNAINLASLKELSSVLIKNNDLEELTSWDDEKCLKTIEDVSKLNITLADYVKFLDSLDFGILALSVVDYRAIQDMSQSNFDEQYKLYMSLLQIEPLRYRFRILEEKMVIAQVTSNSRNKVADILIKNKDIASIINRGLTASNIDDKSAKLVKMRKAILGNSGFKMNRKPLAVSYSVFSVDIDNSSSLLKLFIINRDLISIITELEKFTNNKSLCLKLKMFMGLDISNNKSISEYSKEEIDKLFTDDKVSECFKEFHHEFIQQLYEGIISSSGNDIVVYDLACEFGEVYPVKEKDYENVHEFDESLFKQYINSFIISYAPVDTYAASAIISGTTRDTLFRENSEMFEVPKYIDAVGVNDLRQTSFD